MDIIADEGVSGSTLERPGLQTALRMIKRGRANTLIVVKRDRLSRSLRDVCTLVSDYFTDERYHLLSVCAMINTHTAAGRMLVMNLANFNEFERAMISERTRDAMQHMKAQGIRLGPAPGLAFNLFGIGVFLTLWLLWMLIRDHGWAGLWLVVFPLSLTLWAARRYSRFTDELVVTREELLHRRWGRERRIRFSDAEAMDFESGRGWCLRAGEARIYIHDQLDGYLDLIATLRQRVTVVPEACRANLPLLLRAGPQAVRNLGQFAPCVTAAMNRPRPARWRARRLGS